MKKLLLLLLFIPLMSFGQDYMGEIALDACLCIEERIIKRKKPVKKNNIPYKFALCVVQSAEPYADDILNDFNLDIESENAAQQLAEMLFVKLVLKCPDNMKELFPKPKP
tara:strand:- start:9 stop:338 length:330 start_codon:yes stop_codon:yes gene_type:complete